MDFIVTQRVVNLNHNEARRSVERILSIVD